MTCRLLFVFALALTVVPAAVAVQQDPLRPGTWKWVTDVPAEHQLALSPPEGKWTFRVMAPGWHITTRPAAILYEPSYTGTGRFSLEAETHLFPGASPSGVGLMVGGHDLDAGTARYTAFMIRRDGSVSVEQRDGGRTTAVVDWTRVSDVVPGDQKDAVRNVLRVDVDAEVTRFFVNGKPAAEVKRPAAQSSGLVGLRVGADLDLHVTNLDLTLKMALPRPSKE